MKTCYYTGGNNKYTWSGQVYHNCIMATALHKMITGDELERLEKIGFINDKELFSIRSLDIRCGDKNNIVILRQLAKRLGIKLIHRRKR